MTPEPASAAGALWRVRPLVALNWHEWPDEGSVAFDDTSGQLVELDELGGAVMACLEAAPHRIDDIASTLAADLGQVPDEPFRDAVAQVVQQFQQLGWVDPIIA